MPPTPPRTGAGGVADAANAFGAAVGAAVGGPLCDRYGRKFIYTYDLLLYMLGVLLAVFAVGFPMLMIAFVLTGIAVGAGVTASWTYIAEAAPDGRRAAHVGTAQLAWSVGPMVGYLLAAALEPLGLTGSRIIFAHLFVVAFITWWVRRGLAESQRWTEARAAADRPSFLAGMRELLTHRRNVTALLLLLGVYGLWNAELFATRYRASAQGVLFMLARILVGVLSVFFPVMLTAFGLQAVGVLILALLVGALLIGTLGAPETRGKSLEQIEIERYGRVLDARADDVPLDR